MESISIKYTQVIVIAIAVSITSCSTTPQSPAEEFEEQAEERRQIERYDRQEKYHRRKAAEYAEIGDDLTGQHHEKIAEDARERKSDVGYDFMDFLLEVIFDLVFDRE